MHNTLIVLAICVSFIVFALIYSYLKSQDKDIPTSQCSNNSYIKNDNLELSYLISTPEIIVRREDREVKAVLTEEDERVDCICHAKATNLVFVLVGKINTGGWRLLKITLPRKDDSLEKIEVQELLNSNNETTSYADLYKEQNNGNIDDKTLSKLKEGSQISYVISNIYEASDDGNYLLLCRGDLSLLSIDPVVTSYMPHQPWLYDINNNNFKPIYPSHKEVQLKTMDSLRHNEMPELLKRV